MTHAFVHTSLPPPMLPRSAYRTTRLYKKPASIAGLRLTAKLAQQAEPVTSPNTFNSKCRILDIRHPLPYHEGWDLQHKIMDEMKNDSLAPDVLILLEHEPVYTLGTASKLENVLFDAEELRRSQSERKPGTPLLIRTERGGEVTYHGPGQLVTYPILNLNRHKKDLHWYLRSLEEVVIDMVKRSYGLQAGRKEGLTGVWVGNEKVCAIGLKVSKWITMHGLALNVNTDLKPFERIIPCGITDHGVTSLHLLAENHDVCMEDAKKQLIESFCNVFGPYDLVHKK